MRTWAAGFWMGLVAASVAGVLLVGSLTGLAEAQKQTLVDRVALADAFANDVLEELSTCRRDQ